MKRAQLLITQVQRATENERVGSTDGISTEEYYQYFTDAARFLQRKILAVNSGAFRRVTTFSADGTEDFDLPTDIFARNRIVSLEFQDTGSDQDYRPLDKRTALERFSSSGRPTQYILKDKEILVNAYPTTGTFRLTYNYLVPTVDKRRAVIASRTLSSTAITALGLTASGIYTEADYALADHLTVVGWDGTVKMRGIPYTGVSSGTVTIQNSSYTFPSGSTAPVGDYVCLGENSSSHILMDDQCEDFILTYCQRRILKRDSSADADDIGEELSAMLESCIDVYAEQDDVQSVPVTNYEYWQDI